MRDSYATDVSPTCLDIETVGLPDADQYDLVPITPDARFTDPKKIAADIEAKTQARRDKFSLDRNLGRIVALGYWIEGEGSRVVQCANEDIERTALDLFWYEARHRTIVGFNCKGFDLPFMIQRSRYLGIAHPQLDLGKYSRKGIVDLYLELTFNEGHYDQGAMRRTLKSFCKRFGIPVSDEIDGKDIPALVTAGEWEKVASHLKSDLECTVALARRLGVIQPAREEAVL